MTAVTMVTMLRWHEEANKIQVADYKVNNKPGERELTKALYDGGMYTVCVLSSQYLLIKDSNVSSASGVLCPRDTTRPRDI